MSATSRALPVVPHRRNCTHIVESVLFMVCQSTSVSPMLRSSVTVQIYVVSHRHRRRRRHHHPDDYCHRAGAAELDDMASPLSLMALALARTLGRPWHHTTQEWLRLVGVIQDLVDGEQQADPVASEVAARSPMAREHGCQRWHEH